MRSGILVIGNEVLEGLVLDSNSNWLERRLTALGVQMHRLVTVRDELTEIEKGLRFLIDPCDVIITSGGLGPTHDDMTLKGISRTFDRELCEDFEAAKIVRRQYNDLFERGIVDTPDYTESRKKMALIPQGSVPLDNRVGGAPGIRLGLDNCTIFCLPGVPSEMKFIFDDSVVPWIEENRDEDYEERTVEFPIRDETVFAPVIAKVMKENPRVYIKSMPKSYGTSDVLRVWVSARGKNREGMRESIDRAIREMAEESGLEPSTPDGKEE
ncbi:competence/damage-inducible protein A [Candidatus Thorarchaeota archaeon]|nr:MAG: competence/damage-inducible protein A [Candidatus Thorarchaeota archaeon]